MHWALRDRALPLVAARAAAVFFGLFAVFQLCLALGAPFGEVAWGGALRILPRSLRWASAAAAVYLAFGAGVMAVRAGVLGRRWLARTAWALNAILAVQLALNTAANLASKSPGERAIMGAATAIGCALCVLALLRPVQPL